MVQWKTRIVANTKVGNGTSPVISWNRGLSQGDALCSRLFALCLNPVAWRQCSTEGYRLSRTVWSKVTDLLYRSYRSTVQVAASQAKLDRVLEMTKEAIEDIGLQWNPKKCNALNVRRDVLVDVPEGFKSEEMIIDSLKGDTTYRFLGAPERYFKKKSWLYSVLLRPTGRNSRLSGRVHCQTLTRVQASDQLAVPMLLYLMWSQHWCLTYLCGIDRQARTIACESGGKYPLGLRATVYLQGLWEDVEWDQ